MARIFTEGFEMGDNLTQRTNERPSTTSAYGPVRSGNYHGEVYNNTSYIYQYCDDVTEIYGKMGFKLGNSSSTARIYISNGYLANNFCSVEAKTSSDNNIKAKVNDVEVDSYTATINTDVYYLLEVYFKLDDSVGEIIVKLNGIEIISYSGDTKPTADATFDYIYLGGIGSSHGLFIDDLAVNDTTGTEDNSWCGDGHIIAIKPDANGDSSQLTNSAGDSVNNYSYVDDIPSDGDTTYVWGDTVDNQDLYNLTAPSLPVNHKILRIWAEARAKDPDVGNIALPIKSGTTQSDGSTKGLTTAYSAIKGDEYTTNPDTGVAWTESDLNSLQAGVKIKS